MRDSSPDLVVLDPEEFASSPYLEAWEEETEVARERKVSACFDVHERPTLVP